MMEKVEKVIRYRLPLPLSCLLIVLLTNLVTTPTFFKISITNGALYGYIIDVINHVSELMMLAVGMTLVMSASAKTDISVDAVMAVTVPVCTHMLTGGEVSVNEYANLYIPAVLAGPTVAILYGCFSGLLVAKLKIWPMVATLILFTAGRGVSRLVASRQITYIRMGGYKLLGSNIPGIPIPTPIFVAVLVMVLTYVLLKRTAMGVYVQTVGINEQASRLVDLKSIKIIWMAYTFYGLYAGIAGLVTSSRICSADTDNTGLNMELDTITAVALGGNSLEDGKFSPLGSVTGAYTIQALTATLYAISVSSDRIPVYKTIAVIVIMAVRSEEFKRFRRHSTAKHASKTVEGEAT